MTSLPIQPPSMDSDIPMRYAIVNGIVFPVFVSQQRMDELRNFPLRVDDVFVVTYPKSGTTWTQQIMKLIRSGGQKDGTRLDKAIPWLETLNQKWEKKLIPQKLVFPRFFKSHAPYHLVPGGPAHTTRAKYIYIARNPRDALVSYYYHCSSTKHVNFTGTWDKFFELFMSGRVPFGSWFDHVLEWWKHRDDPNVLFLKYEDMQKDLPGAVTAIAEFMGYKLKPEVIESIAQQSSFQSMKSNPAANYSWIKEPLGKTFMRKGTVGDWKNHFTAEQVAEFDAVYAARMQGTGLNFESDLQSKL